jgi:hypothetical protein
LDSAQNFPEAVFLGVDMKLLLDDEDVWCPYLSIGLKAP